MSRGPAKELLPLADVVTHLLEECRMVLPGIQALFGFQLIAVFNPRFTEDCTHAERLMHLTAIGLVALAIGLVMTPAAYHRQQGGREVSDDFLLIGSRLLLASMFPLMIGIALDFYIIARLILNRPLVSLMLAMALVAMFLALWFWLPKSPSLRRMIRS